MSAVSITAAICVAALLARQIRDLEAEIPHR
jgi:hypothetical protein